MNFFKRMIVKWVREDWEKASQPMQDEYANNKISRMGTIGVAQIERGRAEGENRITFELSTAVGGKILNVRHYDDRKDRHDQQTYVIPNGEDVGERVAKIINLELFKQ